MNASPRRVGGRVRLRKPTFAIIVGDDSKHYMVLPTEIEPPSRFEDLREGMPVQGQPYLHKRIVDGKEVIGDRMTKVVIVAVDPSHTSHQQHHGSV